jgi:hypothetical protein
MTGRVFISISQFLKGIRSAVLNDNTPHDGGAATYTEKHFSVAEISLMWGFGKDLVRRTFQHEPGVIAIKRPAISRRKRPYTTIRVPESVLRRVYARLTNYQFTP